LCCLYQAAGTVGAAVSFLKSFSGENMEIYL